MAQSSSQRRRNPRKAPSISQNIPRSAQQKPIGTNTCKTLSMTKVFREGLQQRPPTMSIFFILALFLKASHLEVFPTHQARLQCRLSRRLILTLIRLPALVRQTLQLRHFYPLDTHIMSPNLTLIYCIQPIFITPELFLTGIHCPLYSIGRLSGSTLEAQTTLNQPMPPRDLHH